MFDSMTQNSIAVPKACFTSFVASLTVHTAMVAAVFIFPLFCIQGLPRPEPPPFVFTTPKLPVPVTPSPSAPSGRSSSKHAGENLAVSQAEVTVEKMTMPDKIPRVIPPPTDEHLFIGVGQGLTGLIGKGGDGPGPAWPGSEFIVPMTVGNPPPAPVPEPNVKKAPLRVGVLNPSKLIYRITPVYPELAKSIRLSGMVHLEVLINEEGNVAAVEVKSGNLLLRDAAVQAVRQWKYTPTVQNGEPIPILATVRVFFRVE